MSEDEAIVRALEAMPAVPVAEDFAARVVARLPARCAVSIAEHRSVGRVAAMVAIATLFMAMVAVAPRSQGSEVWMSMQVLLFIEFSGLLLWVSFRAAP